MEPNWLDRAIAFMAPRAGLKRIRARAAAENLVRHYEGAATGRRTEGWRRTSGDASSAQEAALANLRNAARDMVRNNGHAESALTTICDHVVGWGIVAKAKPKNARAAKLWEEWAGTTACDADGQDNLAGLQHLVVRTIVESGEVLVRRRFRRPGPEPDGDGLPIPMQIQVLEPDYLDTSKTMPLPNGGSIVYGVEFDPLGRRVAYWLFAEHPGSLLKTGLAASRRIPAEGVLHIYRKDRASQVRGASWFAPVLLKFKDYDDYDDATLMKQKVAACLAVITSDVDGTAPALGIASGDDGLVDSLEPGMILNVPPGRTIETVQPPTVREYSDYSTTTLRAIATGLGVSYEDLTGNYCVAPETRVLRADLRWVRADELRPGEQIVAFDEEAPGGRGNRRKWRKASVLRTGRRELNRKRIRTETGAVVVSDEHPFLCTLRGPTGAKRGSGLQARSENADDPGYGQRWVRADQLQPGDRIVFLCRPWEEGRSHAHGYLKGMADGEGCLDKGDAKIAISQNAGPVYDELGEELRILGFQAVGRAANGGGKVQTWTLMGIAECLRFLGEVRPTRLLRNADSVYDGRMMCGGGKKSDKQTSVIVEAIENLGVGEVITLETSTRTLITEGFCSHNSEVNFSSARMARLRHWSRVENWRWRTLIPGFCDPVWRWAMEVAGIFAPGRLPQASWTAPPLPMIEPDKEGLAYQRNIRSGIMTLSEAIRERGYDPDEMLAEMAADNKKVDQLELILDSDARNTTQSGSPRYYTPPELTDVQVEAAKIAAKKAKQAPVAPAASTPPAPGAVDGGDQANE